MKARFQPKVSVVIPTFNRAALVSRAITSVLSQTERDLEVVVIDDASEDDARSVIESIGDDRITYHRNVRNLGEPRSRNVGIERARGHYVGFLDDDDVWLPQKLEQQFKSLALDAAADWVYCGWQWVDMATGTVTKRRTPDARGRVEGLPRWAYNVAVDFLVRRDVLLKTPFDHTLSYYMPCDLVLRLSQSYKAAAVPEILVTCYTHGGPRASDQDAGVKVRDIDTLFRRYGEFMHADPSGWARFNLILGVLYSRELRDRRKARGPLREVVRSQPSDWRGWAYLLQSALAS